MNFVHFACLFCKKKKYLVLKVHIGQRVTSQPVCQFESIPSMAMQVHQIHRAAHVVHHGHDLNRRDCLV